LAIIGGGGGKDNEFFNSGVQLCLPEHSDDLRRTATQCKWKLTENPHGTTSVGEKGHDSD